MIKSIVVDNMDECYICHTTQNLETHHCIGGSKREKADKYKLVVRLCHNHHTGSNYSAHLNTDLNIYFKRLAQIKFEKMYGHELYMKEFGKSYL